MRISIKYAMFSEFNKIFAKYIEVSLKNDVRVLFDERNKNNEEILKK
jgi:hypothetical protein